MKKRAKPGAKINTVDSLDAEKILMLEKKHYTLTLIINFLLLVTHIGLLFLFHYLNIPLMVCVNIISITLYISLFFFYRKSIVKYVFTVLVEVLVHMALATISVGIEGGFQLYTFCLIPCIYLCDYLCKTDGRSSIQPRRISIVVVGVFLCTRVYCFEYGPLYHFPDKNPFVFMYLYNAVVTFIFLIIYMSVFEQKILGKEHQLAKLAEMDELTQLPNRYLMKQWLEDAYRGVESGNSMAIAMLDIDDFKMLNDTYGHDTGDRALIAISDCIRTTSPGGIRSCRWGGEEFLIMAAGENPCDTLGPLMEKLRTDIESLVLNLGASSITMTVTIGIAQYTVKDKGYNDILNWADKHLYIGKEYGKNCVIQDN